MYHRKIYYPKKRTIKLAISILIAAGVSLYGFFATPASDTPTPVLVVVSPTPGTSVASSEVIRVIDGDTVEVVVNGKKESIRLIGVDTPEVHDPRKPVQCFGKEAWDKAKELLHGKQVRLESDASQGDRDKYNRLLRYVFLEDGTFVNKALVSQGYAHEYTYRIPYTYQIEFQQAENDAREQKKGLWADGVCV